MKIIIPMAGLGTRLRPHTLTIPKPLIRIAGKPIVQWLVEEIGKTINEPIDEIAFIIGNFGEVFEKQLIEIGSQLASKVNIYHQNPPLGTGHAIYCAEPSLSGKIVVAFADTLFKTDLQILPEDESIIWVKKVENPSAFGVVKLDTNNTIVDFVEKPKSFVSDLAIIGIYYFRDGSRLRSELKYLLDNDIKVNNEYQLTDALQNMLKANTEFKPGMVTEWLDCGNKDAVIDTNNKLLELNSNKFQCNNVYSNSLIISPCYIGNNVQISNSIIGPFVSIEDNCNIDNSIVANSIVQSNAELKNCILKNSMIGNFAQLEQKVYDISLGDYNIIKP